MKCNSFSVAMCVYGGDNAEWFDTALGSVINQTVKPDEIVLVVDGPIPDNIQIVIDKYLDACKEMLTVLYFKENKGHGLARKYGFEQCKNELIAIMDSDDICVEDRFEKQLEYFEDDKIGIVGGDIKEFIDSPKNGVGYRKVPVNNGEIKKYAKKRCPMNQMTVMMRKSEYLKAGGYHDWYCDEDYYLWLRMMQNGTVFANTGTVLVNVRVGKEMYRRRGGLKYFRSEAKLQKYMLKNKIIGFPRYVLNVSERFVLQVLMPNKLRGWVFKKFARNTVK